MASSGPERTQPQENDLLAGILAEATDESAQHEESPSAETEPAAGSVKVVQLNAGPPADGAAPSDTTAGPPAAAPGSLFDDIFTDEPEDTGDRLKAFAELELLTMIEVAAEAEAVLDELRIKGEVR
jgi:hypothetical protein